ncbi:MAG TPA: threonine--tRNA ligase [Verrucomicrobiae bacterium]|nr:threonine--tRNA ligase [Verrucomicrobiae bacterium]
MQEDQIYAMRHSLAHIMAAAVLEMWPQAKLGVGPVVENGFYYDIDLGEEKISETDFKRIESQMRKIIAQNQPFEHFELPIDEAVQWAKDNDQPYKLELLNDLKRAGTTIARELDSQELGIPAEGKSVVDKVSFYKNGIFVDLCRGPHLSSTGKAGAFKLLRVAGAYWRGKESNPQMQRLYGVAFGTKAELEEHLRLLEEAKKRDHRKLGKELDLFAFSDLVGAGLPLFTPRGTIVRDLLGDFSQTMQAQHGYQKVTIPHITKIGLYKTSGHYEKYPERFIVTSEESDDEFMMKPMNCPHHIQIYASRPRSYKELPIRYMENGVVYRDEKAGELHGLSRVRASTTDDGHVFCTIEQIEDEFTAIMSMINNTYKQFDMKFRARLSFRDSSDAYLGDEELWQKSQQIVEGVARKLKLDYFIAEGEAAFYGPKIDILVTDALGREWQCATQQLDFIGPERFGLTYTAADGSEQRPVMMHKALLGSLERFMSVYIEHTGGWLPFWLAPEQVRVLTLNDEVKDYVDNIATLFKDIYLSQPVKYNELRYTIDNRNESLGKKIREATQQKVPVLAIVGPRDVSAEQVSIRLRDKEETIALTELPAYLTSL